jgi:hypothetical protein
MSKREKKVLSVCHSWRSKKNSAAFQGFHQCQRGILLACFTRSMFLSFMERIRVTMENRKSIILGGEENSMQRSKLRSEIAVQKHDQDQNPWSWICFESLHDRQNQIKWKDRIRKDGESLDLIQGKDASQTDRVIDLIS